MDNGQLKSLVAGKYGLARSTTSTWFLPANKVDIIAAFSSETINLKRKNVKAGKYADLNKAFFKWFMSARSSNKSMCGLALQEKTIDLAKKQQQQQQQLEIANFEASTGWVDRWEERNNVKFKTVSCLEKSCTTVTTGPCKETLVFQPYSQVTD